VKRIPFSIACLILVVAALFGGCATSDRTQGPPPQANPNAPDLRQQVDMEGPSISRPPWAR
jgi:hypothetical protein